MVAHTSLWRGGVHHQHSLTNEVRQKGPRHTHAHPPRYMHITDVYIHVVVEVTVATKECQPKLSNQNVGARKDNLGVGGRDGPPSSGDRCFLMHVKLWSSRLDAPSI